MGDKLVTGLSPDSNKGDGSNNDLPSLSRYTETFEKLCAYYMFLGMTYDEYWDGDNLLPRQYRKIDEMRRERSNFDRWLQGFYVYEAILDASPILNPFSKKKEPIPYRDTPIPITEREKKQAKERAEEKAIERSREAMRIMMAEINKRFNRKEGNDGN